MNKIEENRPQLPDWKSRKKWGVPEFLGNDLGAPITYCCKPSCQQDFILLIQNEITTCELNYMFRAMIYTTILLFMSFCSLGAQNQSVYVPIHCFIALEKSCAFREKPIFAMQRTVRDGTSYIQQPAWAAADWIWYICTDQGGHTQGLPIRPQEWLLYWMVMNPFPCHRWSWCLNFKIYWSGGYIGRWS